MAVGEDPARRPPNRDAGGHLAVRLIRPVHRQLSGFSFREIQSAEDLVVDLTREHTVESRPTDPDGLTEVPVDEVDDVGRVVVQTAPTLVPLAAPRPTLGLEDYRPIGLTEDVGRLPDRTGLEQPLYLVVPPQSGCGSRPE